MAFAIKAEVRDARANVFAFALLDRFF